MASGLQELRKRAGYRTARDFAEAMGIPFTTYARYESSPEKIPLAAAWRLADEFGVSIDIIVGRNEPEPTEERDEVQLRYDALAPEFQSSLDDYLEFLTTKSADTAKRKAEAERRRAEALCARLDSLFLAELDRNEPDVALSATATELRGRFKEYLERRADERREPGVRDSVDKIMAAYDRIHGEFEFKGMAVRYAKVDMAAVRESGKDMGALS